ncbi:MAG: AsmA-like C-terminal region-containing protein, partial [Phycisphaerae bacterium]
GLTGRVRIAGPRIEVIDVAGRHGEARVEVTGTAGVAGRTLRELALSVRGHGVALDQALLGALPQRTRDVVAAFDPAGRIDIDSSVTLVADDPHPRVVSDVTLVDVSARYAGFPLGLTRIMGRLRMTPEEVIVDGVTGRWKESTFSMTGSVDLADDGGAAALTIRSRDLRLGPELRDCLPGPLRTALADWQVDGPLELETTLQADIMDTSKAPRHHTTLRLAGTTVRHAAFPKPFTDVHAEVAIGPRRASATGVSLRFGPAVVNADFEVPYAGTEDAATVRLTARGLPLGGAIRPLWPKHVRDLLDSLRPAGSVDLYLSELRFARGEPDGPRQWTVSGYAELSDVSLGAVDLAGVRGTIAGSGTLFGPAGGTSLTGQIALSGLDLLGQHLTRADARWSLARVAGGEGMLLMESIQAGIYGGTTSGRLEVSFDREGTKYDVSAMVRAMQLQPFVNAARMARGPGDDPIDVAGSTGAQFYLSGVVGDPRSRRGGGSFEITHGRMYRLPIILAIFKLLNLSGINDEAFHEAAAEFFIMGQRVRLDNIRLTGDALSLIGSGSMSLADGGVDLGLVNVTPHRWARIPLITDLVEGASRELVELRVTGPMARPIVRARPLSGVTDEFKRLFKRQRGSPSSAVRADRP